MLIPYLILFTKCQRQLCNVLIAEVMQSEMPDGGEGGTEEAGRRGGGGDSDR